MASKKMELKLRCPLSMLGTFILVYQFQTRMFYEKKPHACIYGKQDDGFCLLLQCTSYLFKSENKNVFIIFLDVIPIYLICQVKMAEFIIISFQHNLIVLSVSEWYSLFWHPVNVLTFPLEKKNYIIYQTIAQSVLRVLFYQGLSS